MKRIQHKPLEICNLEPNIDDLKETLRTLKNNKAPGIDGIPAKLYKLECEQLSSKLLYLIQLLWRKEDMLREWEKAIICPIKKEILYKM